MSFRRTRPEESSLISGERTLAYWRPPVHRPSLGFFGVGPRLVRVKQSQHAWGQAAAELELN